MITPHRDTWDLERQEGSDVAAEALQVGLDVWEGSMFLSVICLVLFGIVFLFEIHNDVFFLILKFELMFACVLLYYDAMCDVMVCSVPFPTKNNPNHVHSNICKPF